jgi:phage N-6-adenine-methyltransferase
MSGCRRCAFCRERMPVNATGRRRRYCSDRCRMAAFRRRNRRLRGSLEVMGSSRTDEWATPRDFFARLEAEFGPFDLDPCATPQNAKCTRYYTRKDDGLAQEWYGRVFMNPPYGRAIGAWMQKAWEASRNGAELVCCLVPARTDTRWWHDYAIRGEVRFLAGRLRFGEGLNPAPFPSAVVVFRNAEGVTKLAKGEAPHD